MEFRHLGLVESLGWSPVLGFDYFSSVFNQDCKLRCSVCNQLFYSLKELCDHKNNDFCKELSNCIQSDDENPASETCELDDGDDEDDDIDIDLDIDDNVPLAIDTPAKKKTRRKYIKNKHTTTSSLICEGEWMFPCFGLFSINNKLWTTVWSVQENVSNKSRATCTYTQAFGQRTRMLGMR